MDVNYYYHYKITQFVNVSASEQERRLQKSVYLAFTDLSAVVVASEMVQRPSEHASSDIFNTDYIWEYGPKGHG